MSKKIKSKRKKNKKVSTSIKKERKKVYKIKTIEELIIELQSMETKILNEIINNPSQISAIGQAYMRGYSKFNNKQIEAYRQMANLINAR